MYEEQIKRLRISAQWADKGLVITPSICLEAADVIEQLSNAGSAYGRGWTLGYDAGREESKPRWIPVTERLPEDGQWVLVWESGKFAYVDKMHNGKWMIADRNYAIIYYWMPLPEPPKEVNKHDSD